MKVAISTNNDKVANHFGRCPSYTLVDIENQQVTSRKIVENPGHAPGAIPKFLNELGCDVIIAGGMGRRAQGYFDGFNIKCVVGVHGEIEQVIEDILNDDLEIGESTCDHGEGKGSGKHGHYN